MKYTDREVDMIFKAVCEEYGFYCKEDYISEKRNREMVDARNITMFLFVHWLNFSVSRSAKLVNRDRVTCLHGMKTFDDLIHTDKCFSWHYNNIVDKIQHYQSLS